MPSKEFPNMSFTLSYTISEPSLNYIFLNPPQSRYIELKYALIDIDVYPNHLYGLLFGPSIRTYEIGGL